MENGLTFKPLKANIVVRMDPAPERSKSGHILFPDGALEHVNRTGKVVDVGPEVHEPAIGDRVLFVRFLAEVHTKKMLRDKLGQDILVCDAKDIILVFGDEDEERLR